MTEFCQTIIYYTNFDGLLIAFNECLMRNVMYNVTWWFPWVFFPVCYYLFAPALLSDSLSPCSIYAFFKILAASSWIFYIQITNTCSLIFGTMFDITNILIVLWLIHSLRRLFFVLILKFFYCCIEQVGNCSRPKCFFTQFLKKYQISVLLVVVQFLRNHLEQIYLMQMSINVAWLLYFAKIKSYTTGIFMDSSRYLLTFWWGI